MTVAAVIFCTWIAVAFAGGFGAPAFTRLVARDAFGAIMPFLGLLLVARFAAARYAARQRLVHRVHGAAQGAIASVAYGWWWIEPHAALTSLTASSLGAMGWLALAGMIVGFTVAILAERRRDGTLLREIALGTWAFLLFGGGRIYRAFDHVEAGARVTAAGVIVAGTVVCAILLWLLLRRRERAAVAIPAVAPLVACVLLLAASQRTGEPRAASPRDSIVLVVVDTLRADVTDGRFAADPDAMPELARIAAAGVRFTDAVSPAPWTLPAVASLLSGSNPHRHGIGASASPWEAVRGRDDAIAIPSALRDAGYATAAFLNNPWLRPWFGFDRGFYVFRPYHGRALDGVALALDWLQGHADTTTFTMVHLMDPHWPYEPTPGFGEERRACEVCDSLFFSQFGATTPEVRAELARRYAAEVRFTDAMLGRFYDALSNAGMLEHTWIIVTADHGEEFWDHGSFLHGHSLYDELLRVPLVVVPPAADEQAKRGLRVDVQVRLEDVAATIYDIAGLDAARARDGRSLVPLLSGASEPQPRVAIAGFVKSPTDLRWAVRRPPWKATVSSTMSENRLFRLDRDPGETRNLTFNPSLTDAERAETKSTFQSLALEPKRLGLDVARTAPVSRGAVPDADTKSKLRSLGYAN